MNSGNGDGGVQIKLADGNCAIANLAGMEPTPALWGAKGDGTTDDTVAVQAAINGAVATGMPLHFDAKHLFNITATLNITSPLHIEGPSYRYGIWAVNQPSGTGTMACPWGLVTKNTGITMINASAVTGTIRGMCIDMTGDGSSNPTGGDAIKIAPPNTSTYSSGWNVELNTILQPYNGITIPGNGPGAGCCGIGTSADGDTILRTRSLALLMRRSRSGRTVPRPRAAQEPLGSPSPTMISPARPQPAVRALTGSRSTRERSITTERKTVRRAAILAPR